MNNFQCTQACTAAGKAALFHEIRFHPEWRDRKAEFELIITLWLELQGIPSPPTLPFFFSFLLKIIKLDEARYLSSELFHSSTSKEIKSSNNFMQRLVLYASGSVANLTITNNSLVFQSFNFFFFSFWWGKEGSECWKTVWISSAASPCQVAFSLWVVTASPREHLQTAAPDSPAAAAALTATGGSSALQWCHSRNSFREHPLSVPLPCLCCLYSSGCGGVKIFQFWVKEQ